MCGVTTGVVSSGLGWTAEQLAYLFARTRGGKMEDAHKKESDSFTRNCKFLICRCFGGGGIHDSVRNCGIMGPVTNEGLGGLGDVLFLRCKICRAEMGFVCGELQGYENGVYEAETMRLRQSREAGAALGPRLQGGMCVDLPVRLT